MPKAPAELFLHDPDNIGVKVIDGIVAAAWVGTNLDIALATLRIDGKGGWERIVASRLRVNLNMAKMIRDTLTTQIDFIEKKGPSN